MIKEPKEFDIFGVKVRCMSWFLSVNDHAVYYETISGFYGEDLEGIKMGETDDVFVLTIYDNTPVSCTEIYGNTFEDVIKELKEIYEG